MDTLENTKMPKSIYMDTLGYIFSPNTAETVAVLTFQGIYQDDHLFVRAYLKKLPLPAKVLISPPLGILDIITLIARECWGNRSKPVIRVNQGDKQMFHLPVILVCG
jgi:hypothetical protein